MIREDLLDPVRNFVVHYAGEQEALKRQVLTADSVSQDQRGLRQLVKAGCFRAAVNLTSRLLCLYNQGPGQGGNLTKHTPSSLQVGIFFFGLEGPWGQPQGPNFPSP